MAAALSLAVLFVIAHLHPDQVIQDDSYFYLQNAWNIAAGFGSTFNQITLTNGYHPLWQLVCAGIAWLAGGDKRVLLHGALALQQLLFVATLLMLGGIVRRMSPSAPRWLLLPVPIYGFLLLRTYACEAFLYAFLCVAALVVLQRLHGPARVPQAFAFGLLCGLLFLARLDAIFLAGALLVAFLLAFNGGSLTTAAALTLASGAGFLLVAAPYFAFNLQHFGHLVPISGAIKSTFPFASFVPGRLGIPGSLGLLSAVGLAALLARRGPGGGRWVVLPLIAGTILHAAYTVMFTSHDTRWVWYYVPGLMCGALLTALLGEGWPAARLARWGGVAFLIVAPLAAAYRYAPELRGPGPTTRWQVRAARYLAATLPDSTGILVADWPGIFAFYSDRRIVSTDGLTADYRYNDDVVREGITEFCRRRNISHYIGFEFEYPRPVKGHVNRIRAGLQEVTVYAPLTHESAGVLMLPDSMKLARFQEMFPEPDARVWRMALWKLF
jgi:hypothetical protein